MSWQATAIICTTIICLSLLVAVSMIFDMKGER